VDLTVFGSNPFNCSLQDKQEQERVAVGPGNAHSMSIRHVPLRVALAGSVLWPVATAALLLL